MCQFSTDAISETSHRFNAMRLSPTGQLTGIHAGYARSLRRAGAELGRALAELSQQCRITGEFAVNAAAESVMMRAILAIGYTYTESGIENPTDPETCEPPTDAEFIERISHLRSTAMLRCAREIADMVYRADAEEESVDPRKLAHLTHFALATFAI